MDCKEFNNKIREFIKDDISDDSIEGFITHYYSCETCREELEIYYLINKIFDENNLDSDIDEITSRDYNLKERLYKDIKEKEDLIYAFYKKNTLFILMYLLCNILSILVAFYFLVLS